MKSYRHLVALVCSASILASCGALSDKPSNTIKTMFDRLQKGQIDAFVELYSNRIKQNPQMLLRVKSVIAGLPLTIKANRGVTVEILNEDIVGDTATVTFNLRYGNGQVEGVKYRMIRENGKWLCDGNA